VFTSKIPAGSEISSSHRASGVPAGVRSVPRWRGGTLAVSVVTTAYVMRKTS